jgi:PIN domain nuclease of toxin-antitoxin system
VRVIDSSSLVKFFSREEGWDRVKEVILEGVMSLDLSFKELLMLY